MQLATKSRVVGSLLVLCCVLAVAGCNKSSSNTKKTPDQPAPNSTEIK